MPLYRNENTSRVAKGKTDKQPKGCVTPVATATDIPLVPKWYATSDRENLHFGLVLDDPSIN